MTLAVINNSTITLTAQLSIVPTTASYIDFNFYGWIEGALVPNPSPSFQLPIRIWDSCSAALDYYWNQFSDMELVIGLDQPVTQTRSLDLNQKYGFGQSIQSQCGQLNFNLSLSSSTTPAQETLASLVSLSFTNGNQNGNGNSQTLVSITVQPTNDITLDGTSLTVTVNGFSTQRALQLYSTSFKITAILNYCYQSSFPSAPIILQSPVNYYPSVNSTIQINVQWELDTLARQINRPGGCGPYTLKLFQNSNETPYDQSQMTITVVNNETITLFASLSIVPSNAPYIDFNFYGWIEGALVPDHSPQFVLPIRIWDSCAAALDFYWNQFSDMQIVIGSNKTLTQTRSLDYNQKNGFGSNINNQCGQLSFNLSLSTPTNQAEQSLAALISFNYTYDANNGYGNNQASVTVTVQPTDDVSLDGTNLTVTVTGYSTQRAIKTYSTDFQIYAVLNYCYGSSFPSAPVVPQSPINYYPSVNGTIIIGVFWEIDSLATQINRIGGCGPYTLKLFQNQDETPYDFTKMTITVVNNQTISLFSSLSIIPSNQPYIDFNFYGWVEGALVPDRSPIFLLPIRIWDSCAAALDYYWNQFEDMQLDIGGNYTLVQTRSLDQSQKNGYSGNLNSQCGSLTFSLSLSTPTSPAEQALASLISFNVTNADGNDKSYVSIIVQPTNDWALNGTSLTVTITGYQSNRLFKQYSTTFVVYAVLNQCYSSNFPSAPYVPSSPINYYPVVNDTIYINVLWELDLVGRYLSQGCGPYTLKIFQRNNEAPYDQAQMTINVVDNRTISLFTTLKIVPDNSLYIDYNFYGWVEGALVPDRSPIFELPIRIWDSCAAAYDLSWFPFADMELEIGSGVGINQTVNFTQVLKNGFNPNSNGLQSLLSGGVNSVSNSNNLQQCGSLRFTLTVSSPTTDAQRILSNLIKYQVINSQTYSQVQVFVDASDDFSLLDASSLVTVTGSFANNPLKLFTTNFTVFATVKCFGSAFPSAPVITSPINYWPDLNGTIQVPVQWQIDSQAFRRAGGCGPYTLNIFQVSTDAPYDPSKFSISASDNQTISLFSTIDVIPIDSLYKDFNFYGYVKGDLVKDPSPTFSFTVRVWDTCTAAYDIASNTFTDMEVEIGSGLSVTQTKNFTRVVKNGFNLNLQEINGLNGNSYGNLFQNCGNINFQLSLSNPTTDAQRSLASLISLSVINIDYESQVTVTIAKTDDLALEGASLTVTLKGYQELRPLKSYTTDFSASATVKCGSSQFTSAPVV